MQTRLLLLITILVLSVAACGDEADDGTEATTPLTSLPSVTSVPPPSPSTSSPTTTAPASSTTVLDTTTTEAPEGYPSDFGPHAGDVLAVVGVRHDDTLNLRAGPGTRHDIVGTIEPTSESVVALGEAWVLEESFWTKVAHGGVTGWVSMAYVAYLGPTDDRTAAVLAALGGTPVDTTMEGLGRQVAESLASREPPSRIVLSVTPTPGDRSEVTYDVVGVGDDAIAGVRVHVFATGTPGRFVLDAVEATDFCARGVTADDLCV